MPVYGILLWRKKGSFSTLIDDRASIIHICNFFFHIYVEWPIPSPIQISQLDTNLKCRDHAYPIDIYLFICVVYAHKSQDLVYLLKKHLSVYNAYALIGIKL